MARLTSLNILLEDKGKDLLAESYGKVIENIEKTTISSLLKNTDLSGDPTTGSVEAKRFANTESQDYGTARSGGKGQAIKAKPVTVQLDTDRELINEVEDKDAALYGVDGLISRKSSMDEKSMRRELERAFFNVAGSEGTTVTLTATEINEQVEELILKAETLKNDYIDGIDRDMLSVVLSPEKYSAMRNYLDKVENANIQTNIAEFGMYHGVKVFPSVYLPADLEMTVMCDGAIAQPVTTTLDEANKFPASNAWHFGMFYSYGAKAVMPDTIFNVKTA